MKFSNIIKLIVSVVVSELAGVIGALFTTSEIPSWYATLNRPSITPPSWIFGPVWTTLFALMGIAFFIVWKNNFTVVNELHGNAKKTWNKYSEKLWTGNWKKANLIAVFVIQLVLNTLWSIIFFGLHNPGLALFEIVALWIAIVFTIANFYRVSRTAAWLLVPYLAWVTFATSLNYSFWILN